MPGRWAKEAGKPNRYYEPNQGCVRSPLTSQPNIQAEFSPLECVERGPRLPGRLGCSEAIPGPIFRSGC